ncbi:MAG TPA: hypothetical protein VFV32_12285 [Acidimicrobiales bacterium]|nr:hypothetical protein [Acidimicrobiales bacterium]
MDRRGSLRTSAAAGAALGPAFWRSAYAETAEPGVGPYGAPAGPDKNGLWLPEGFRSRVMARSGLPVAGTTYLWPIFPTAPPPSPPRRRLPLRSSSASSSCTSIPVTAG